MSPAGDSRATDRAPRSDRRGAAPFTVGAVVLATIAVLTYFGFAKHMPFTHGHRVHAIFQSANSIRAGSPVRIAGVNVGKVEKVERAGSSDAAKVTLELQDRALPLHRDATARIRPRIFLEGNFFVDLQPGTPSAPRLPEDGTIPITRTSAPVQLDQVLTSLQYDARQDLRDLLHGYGTALTHRPTPAEDAGQDPLVRGRTAAEALNDSLRHSGPALRGVSVVNDALLGTAPHDVYKLLRGLARISAGLDRNEGRLQALVTDFAATTGAFASEEGNLRASIRLLAPTLEVANRTLADLNRAFPPTRAFAREVLPGVRETPATIDAAFPWIAQARPLLGPRELGGLVNELQPTTTALGHFVDDMRSLLPQVDLIDRCLTDVILPTGDVKIADGAFSTNTENYKEFWYTLVALSGEGQNFDGNGMYVRFQPGGGPFTVSTGPSTLTGDPLFGNAAARPLGTRPRYPGRRPAYVTSVPCYRSQPPDLNGPAADIGPVERTIGNTGRARPATAVRRRTAGIAPRPGESLTGELVSRLNPFRGEGELLNRAEARP